MPFTTVVVTKKMSDQPSPTITVEESSPSYSASSSSSSSSTNAQDMSSWCESPSSPSSFSLQQGNNNNTTTANNNNNTTTVVVKKNSVRKTIKEYHKIEGLLEKNDEGLQLLRLYLSERRNEEMLIYLESNREFKLMKQNYSENVNMKRTCLMREFKTIHDNFVNFESLTCMNIANSIREPFTQTLKEVLLLKVDETPNETLCEKMEKCLDNLLFSIQLQFNNEIMTHFKKSAEFKTFVITKLIELSASETSSAMEEMEKTSPRNPGEYLISNLLLENEMEEYSKTFAKKKLVTIEQLRNFTADDYRDKIGMKKIGHLKRIVRVVNEQLNKLD